MARKKRTDGYANRLRQALREGPRPMSVRRLADQLGGSDEKGVPARYPGLRGTSYGGVRQYAEEGGVKNPRHELLRAMADVLEVRPDWLSFNEGEITEELEQTRALERRLATAADAGTLNDQLAEEFHREFLGHLDQALLLFPAPVSRIARVVFVHAWNHWLRGGEPYAAVRFGGRGQAETLAGLAAALAAPFRSSKADTGQPNSATLEKWMVEGASPMARALAECWEANPKVTHAEQGNDDA